MKTLAFDTETYLLNQSGKATTLTVPRLVCLSYAEDGERPGLLERARATRFIEQQLRRDDVRFVGHNVAFDLLVVIRAVREDLDIDLLPRVFELFAQGRIHDTLVRDLLIDISRGGRYIRGHKYGLADLAKRYLGVTVEGKSGPDVWRLRYNELEGVPVSEYPAAAYEYALLDAVYTLDVFKAQPLEFVPTEDFQTASDFVLSLISAWGVTIDVEWATAVDGWFARLEAWALQTLVDYGLADPSGKVPLAPKRELITQAYASLGRNPPLTATGAVSTDKATLKELEDLGYEHPAFRALIDYARATKYRSTYLEPLLDAGEAGAPLCGRYNVLVDSTRTSASNPNMQNFVSRPTPNERFGELWFRVEEGSMSPYERLMHPKGFGLGPDIRGCVVPREGNVIVGADYAAIEMAGLAQVIHNLRLTGGREGALMRSINAGEDQHLRVVSEIRGGQPYEELVELHAEYNEAMKAGRVPKDLTIDFDRFTAKSANYSFPVGAAASTWASNLKNFGVDISPSRAEAVRNAWYEAWPEMREFHAYVSALEGYDGLYEVPLHGPDGMVHGWAVRKTDRFTSAGNSLFQSIVASGAKLALQLVAQECYVDKASPLYGWRMIVFEHDAIYMEGPREEADEAGARLTDRMIAGMKRFIPDVKVDADYSIYPERWTFK